MESLVFKRWSNKKWAAFASLKKVIIIATLSPGYQMLAQPAPHSQGDSIAPMHLELEEVEASGTSPGELDEVSLRPVVVLGTRDISEAGGLSHDDLLDQLPGLDIRQRGKHGTQADLSIQGGTFDQSLVLLNGINLNDPQTGHFHLNLPLSLPSTSHMEVLSGSATRHFGSHAFSGAVNVVTQTADSSFLRAGMKAGQYGLYQGHALLNLAGNRWQSLISASTSGSQGYRENTDFRNHHAYYHGQLAGSRWNPQVLLGLNRRAFGANAFYSPRFPQQYEETSTGFAALKGAYGSGRKHWNFQAYLRMNRDHFLLDRQNPAFYQNDHLSQVVGADLAYRLSWTGGLTRLGLSYRSEGIRSTSLGEELERPKGAWFNDSISFSHGIRRDLVNAMVNHSWHQGPLRISGGFLLYVDPSSRWQENSGIYPGLDARLQVAPRWKVHASVNRSMRLPTFTDLYYQGPANVGNPELKAEKAWTYELGISRHRPGDAWKLSLNGWFRQGRELIDWVWMEDERWHTLNFSRVHAMGAELLLGYRPSVNARSWLHVRRADLSYSLGHQMKLEEAFDSRYLLDYLKHKLVVGGSLGLGPRLSLHLLLNAQDREGSFGHYDAERGESMEMEYAPFATCDVKLSYHLWRFQLFGEASNLFDTPYYDIGNVPMPGRWFSAGFSIQ